MYFSREYVTQKCIHSWWHFLKMLSSGSFSFKLWMDYCWLGELYKGLIQLSQSRKITTLSILQSKSVFLALCTLYLRIFKRIPKERCWTYIRGFLQVELQDIMTNGCKTRCYLVAYSLFKLLTKSHLMRTGLHHKTFFSSWKNIVSVFFKHHNVLIRP